MNDLINRKRTFLAIAIRYPKICTYPKYEGKPYYGIKYLEDGEIIVGFGTYNPEVLSEYLRDYFIPSAEPDRPKGKWEKHAGMNETCSECGHYFPVSEFDTRPFVINFCPYCGAEMD